MIRDYLKIVIDSLLHRKLRSWLTIIAIVIGIASVISLISISQSLQNSIEEQFDVFGADKIMVMPASVGGMPDLYTGLSTEDLEAVERVADFENVIPYLGKSATVEFKKEIKKVTYLYGVPSDKTEILFKDFGIKAEEGRLFTTDSYVVVLGPVAAEDLFEEEIRLRNKIEIEGKKFAVIGILEPVGNPQDDSVIYMPLKVMRELFDDKDTVSMIQANVKSGRDINEVAEKTTQQLKKVRDEEEFDVITAEQLMEQLGAVLLIVQAVLVSIAAISLVVGGIGIANVMYTSVMQRTREIGIMKSVGATNRTILLIFVMEAGLIGLAGGIIGVLLGALIAMTVGMIAAGAGWPIFKVSISPVILLFGLVFSVLVGMVSGALPAMQASKLKPVDALRYGK